MSSSEQAKKKKQNHVQERKWCFAAGEENESVYTVYSHNKAALKFSNGEETGRILSTKGYANLQNKIVVSCFHSMISYSLVIDCSNKTYSVLVD